MTLSNKSFKYNYIVNNPTAIRLANLFAFVSYIFVIYGFTEFLKISLWYTIIFGPLLFIISYSRLSQYFSNMLYPEFKLEKHFEFISNFWSKNNEPSVDIFLPVAGEDIKTLNNTWVGVSKINYENLNVYVLDDGHSRDVKKLAEKFNFNYLARPNKGEFKKSGNLQYGIDNSKGEFIFILDADFKPIPESLLESIPYIASRPKTSILQTPQYFDSNKEIHERSAIEYGSAASVEEFYRVIMPSRSNLGSGLCVGTSGIYRRKAIQDIGGMPKINGSEDIRIGMMTINEGYNLEYLPIIISKGQCPDDIQSYFKQQSRWADGTISSVLSNLFFNNKLSIWNKFSYLYSLLFYINEAISPIVSFQIIALLYFNTESIKLSWIIPFVPYLFYELIIRPKMKLNKFRFGTRLAGILNILAYSDALVRYVFKSAQKWNATGTKIKKSVSNEFLLATIIANVFNGLFIGAFGYVIASRPQIINNWETWILVVIALKRIYEFTIFSIVSAKYIISRIVADIKSKSSSPIPNTVYGTSVFIVILAIAITGFYLSQSVSGDNIINISSQALGR